MDQPKPKFRHRIGNFYQEVKAEMKKVTWPTKPELYGSTGVVIVVTFLLTAFLGTFDSVLGHAMQFFLAR